MLVLMESVVELPISTEQEDVKGKPGFEWMRYNWFQPYLKKIFIVCACRCEWVQVWLVQARGQFLGVCCLLLCGGRVSLVFSNGLYTPGYLTLFNLVLGLLGIFLFLSWSRIAGIIVACHKNSALKLFILYVFCPNVCKCTTCVQCHPCARGAKKRVFDPLPLKL